MMPSGSRIDGWPQTFVEIVNTKSVPITRSPPIVGVPALVRCDSGPSSLIALPKPCPRSQSMSGPPASVANSAAAVPMTSPLAIALLQRLEQRLERDRARSLQQYDVVRP